MTCQWEGSVLFKIGQVFQVQVFSSVVRGSKRGGLDPFLYRKIHQSLFLLFDNEVRFAGLIEIFCSCYQLFDTTPLRSWVRIKKEPERVLRASRRVRPKMLQKFFHKIFPSGIFRQLDFPYHLTCESARIFKFSGMLVETYSRGNKIKKNSPQNHRKSKKFVK